MRQGVVYAVRVPVPHVAMSRETSVNWGSTAGPAGPDAQAWQPEWWMIGSAGRRQLGASGLATAL